MFQQFRAGLTELGLNMVEYQSESEIVNSFFKLFADSKFEDQPVENRHIVLQKKLVDYISKNRNNFSEVGYLLPFKTRLHANECVVRGINSLKRYTACISFLLIF